MVITMTTNLRPGKTSKTSIRSLGLCSSGITYIYIAFAIAVTIACNTVYRSSVVSTTTSYLRLESIIQTPSPMMKQHKQHSPRRFSDNIQLNVDRGLNIVNMLSGQHISSWIYEGRKPVPKHHVWKNDPKEKMLYDPTDAASMKNNDTLFVSYAKIEEFTRNFLPHINTTFVLITTRFHTNYPTGIDLLAPNITSHSHLLYWFAPNIQNYTGGYEFHPKVAPFPLGLKSNMGGRLDSRNPLPYFRQAFLETWNNGNHNNETEFQDKKTNNIFVGYIATTTNPLGRSNIPSGPKLNYVDHLREILQSKYVLSPDGNHPDCHRHYESIGLGAIPITQLDPYFYSHLREGPIIYNNTIWNLTELNSSLAMMQPRRLSVNRNMVFEEYWIEYVERIVGRPLRWWDVNQNTKATLDQFSLSSSSSVQIYNLTN
jgi:hypothetical protein